VIYRKKEWLPVGGRAVKRGNSGKTISWIPKSTEGGGLTQNAGKRIDQVKERLLHHYKTSTNPVSPGVVINNSERMIGVRGETQWPKNSKQGLLLLMFEAVN